MMNLIRALLIGAGVYLGVQWYQDGTPSKAPNVPSNVVLEVGEEVFPSPPQNALASVLEPLETILKGEAGDSLLLARAYRDFAVLTARTPGAVSLQEYSQDYKNALKALLMNTSLDGKYQGRIDGVLNKSFETQFEYMAVINPQTGEKEYPNQVIDQTVRNKLVEWLNACSGKFHEIYLQNLQETGK